jgi:hypothetical protein
MSSDVFNETVVSFSQATGRLPRSRTGKSIHISALYRWVQRGLRAYDGQVVRLETIKIGGTTCTSLEAMQRFFERLSRPTPIVAPPMRTNRQRMLAVRRANEELERAGW